jgi:hypothetical protein
MEKSFHQGEHLCVVASNEVVHAGVCKSLIGAPHEQLTAAAGANAQGHQEDGHNTMCVEGPLCFVICDVQ